MWSAQYIMPKTAALIPMETPSLTSPEEVRIQVAYAGICQDDLLIYAKDHRSLEWPGLSPVVGHEYSGIITAVGERAENNWRVGDRVSGLAWRFCGTCYYCKNGMENHCTNQEVVSTFATEIVMNQKQICRLPDDVSLQEGVFTDPVSYCLHSDPQHVFHEPMPNVLIFGSSAMAMIMVQLARLQGADQIVMIEPNAQKAAVALSLGATHVIDPTKQNVVISAMTYTGGYGYHMVYEMARQPEYLEIATKVLAFQGSILISSMYDTHYLSLSELFMRDGRVRCFSLAPYMLMETMRIMPKLKLAPLITKVFPFEQINEAFQMQEQASSIKVLLEISPSG